MNLANTVKTSLVKCSALALIAALFIAHIPAANASGGSTTGGATDVAGATTGKASGGKTKTTTTTGSTATAVGTVTLAFSPAAPVNGVSPICAGTYNISAYYPTLYLLSAHVGVSSLNVADGSSVYVSINGPSGVISTSYMTVFGGSGTALFSMFCAPTTVVQNITITDLLGNVISIGQ